MTAPHSGLIAIGLMVVVLVLAPSAQAGVTRIVIETVESPAFDGVSYGEVGGTKPLKAAPSESSTPMILSTPSSRTSNWRPRTEMVTSSTRPLSFWSSPSICPRAPGSCGTSCRTAAVG